jgi:GTP-binding protein EngB required for normal cell division
MGLRRVMPLRSTLDYLDRLSLGYLAKKRHGRRVAEKFKRLELQHGNKFVKAKIRGSGDGKKAHKLPFPFNKCPHNVTRMATVATMEDFPSLPYGIPTVVVIGRSNVGKSSLMNALLGFDNSFVQKCVVSERPGETQSIDVYGIGKGKLVTVELDNDTKYEMKDKNIKPLTKNEPKGLVICDLPGYGFGYLSTFSATRMAFLVQGLLVGSREERKDPPHFVKRVLLLVDARHGFKRTDILFFEALRRAHLGLAPLTDDEENEYASDNEQRNLTVNINKIKRRPIKLPWKLQIVLTKCDLVERTLLARRLGEVDKALSDGMLKHFGSNLPTMCVGLARPGPGRGLLKSINDRARHAGIPQLRAELASLLPRTGKH